MGLERGGAGKPAQRPADQPAPQHRIGRQPADLAGQGAGHGHSAKKPLVLETGGAYKCGVSALTEWDE